MFTSLSTFFSVGMVSGVLLQVTFATLALYTNFLLVSLHATYRHRINNDPNHPHFNNEDHIVSYTGKQCTLSVYNLFSLFVLCLT